LFLYNAYSIDVTPLPLLLNDPCMLLFNPLDATSMLAVFGCRHKRPVRFYGVSVESSFVGVASDKLVDPISGTGTMGFPLSLEGGPPLSTLKSTYPKNRTCEMVGDVCRLRSQTPLSPWIFVGAVAETTVDDLAGVVSVVGNLEATWLRSLKLGFTSLFSNVGTSTRMPLFVVPESPSWITFSVTTTQPVNTMRLNWRFEATGEGFLRIFVDGNPVREIDQRHVPPGISHHRGDLHRRRSRHAGAGNPPHCVSP
jgi:hypothetical protein